MNAAVTCNVFELTLQVQHPGPTGQGQLAVTYSGVQNTQRLPPPDLPNVTVYTIDNVPDWFFPMEPGHFAFASELLVK
jgi:hypothetical protein